MRGGGVIGVCVNGVQTCVVFFKQKTANEMRIIDWSSDVGSSDLPDSRFSRPDLDIHSVIRPTTGSSVGPNSVDDAFSIPARFRTPSMHAICMPKQMPK